MPGVTITESGGSTDVAEGGASDTYDVVLTSEPTADVTITITPDAQSTVAPASLIFTSSNWNAAQTVTVTAVDDVLAEGPHASTITHGDTSGDPNYNGAVVTINDVVANIADDDVPGVSVLPTSGLTTDEAGGSDTFDVVLLSPPTADVTIAVLSLRAEHPDDGNVRE